MQPQSRTYLWDAQQAARAALLFVADIDQSEFFNSLLIQSAVERQLEILGESLNRLRKGEPSLAETVPDLHRIVGMRNVIAHEYGTVDYAIVWSVLERRLEPLVQHIDKLLFEE